MEEEFIPSQSTEYCLMVNNKLYCINYDYPYNQDHMSDMYAKVYRNGYYATLELQLQH